jgi:hypothetical protein
MWILDGKMIWFWPTEMGALSKNNRDIMGYNGNTLSRIQLTVVQPWHQGVGVVTVGGIAGPASGIDHISCRFL